MRHKGRKMFVALVAVLALGVVASASASAALPQFVPAEGGKFPIKLESKAKGEWKLADQLGGTITCTSSKLKGEIKGAKALSLALELEGCLSSSRGACETKGLAEGHVAMNGDEKLVYLSKSKKEVATIVTMPNFKCGAAWYDPEGGELLPLSPVNKKGSEIGFTAIGNGAGTMDVHDYENEKGKEQFEEITWEPTLGAGDVSAETGGNVTLTGASQFTLEA
jgi:hypothetical protein